jgi:hypothetical protein
VKRRFWGEYPALAKTAAKLSNRCDATAELPFPEWFLHLTKIAHKIFLCAGAVLHNGM